jgi:hypothetical protein
MVARLLPRPATQLATNPTGSFLGTTGPRRSHQVAARTKRSLNLPPHPDFLPLKSSRPQTEIIINPPSSEASVFHTPFKFLPKEDPKRRTYLATRYQSTITLSVNPSAEQQSESTLPPPLSKGAQQQEKKYHLTQDDVEEIRRLRAEDPATWTIGKLAKKFGCGNWFVRICAPEASREHEATVQAKQERVKARWGPRKTKAREDSYRRKEMLYRGEL